MNFGIRTGAVTVSNLDQATYTGTIAFNPHDPRLFGGVARTSDHSRNMALVGHFFQGRAGPVGEMGGGLTIVGTNYVGGGVFLARQR